MKRAAYPVLVISACFVLTGCPSNNQVALPPPGSVSQVLFAGNAAADLKIFSLPLTSTSSASTTVSGFSTAESVAFDQSNHAFVLDNGPTPPVLREFNLPITSASTPFATIAVTGNTSCVFVKGDASGNLWVSCIGPGEVLKVNGPFTATGSYSGTIGATLTSTGGGRGLAFDAAGDLFVADAISSHIFVFKAPVSTGTPSGSLTAIEPVAVAVDSAGNVYGVAGDGSLQRWNAPVPLTTSGVAASVIDPVGSTGFTFDETGMTFDSSGNLYVGRCNPSGGSISVFSLAGGFSASTTPAFTDTASGCISDIASHTP